MTECVNINVVLSVCKDNICLFLIKWIVNNLQYMSLLRCELWPYFMWK